MRNPAFGMWTEEDTNWSQKDTDFIKDVIHSKRYPYSYEKLLKELEAKRIAEKI